MIFDFWRRIEQSWDAVNKRPNPLCSFLPDDWLERVMNFGQLRARTFSYVHLSRSQALSQ